MEVSVIVPCHNEELTLPAQLDALRAQVVDRSFEVVVVDNNSTDGTPRLVADRAVAWSGLRLVSASGGQGLSYARNVGAAAARGRYLLFCDGDDVAAPGWVAAMSAALDAHALVTGRLDVDALNPDWLAASRGVSGAAGPPRFAGTFAYASGGNQGMHREVFDRVGGFTEGIAGAEDMEFSLRCLQHGVEVVEAPDAVMRYRFRSGARELFRQGRVYGACRPLIARRLHEAGRARPPRLQGWRSWLWLLLHLGGLRHRRGRARWAWVAGNRVGHLEGSVRHRTLLV